MEVSHTCSKNQPSVLEPFLTHGDKPGEKKRKKTLASYSEVRQKLYEARQKIAELKEVNTCQQVTINQLNEQIAKSPPVPFRDPNVYRHGYAASMVALTVNLSNIMPIRTVERALEMILPSLGIVTSIPDRETITRWCKRLGLDRLMHNEIPIPPEKRTDMLWIVDHSNQIGTQKVLVILGIPTNKLPKDGERLSLNQLEVLAIVPGESWTRDDVRKVYKVLAEKTGPPRWVLCDGAVELRESVDVLCTKEHTTTVLRDFKHFAANRFESIIGRSEKFNEFLKLMGHTRCKIQQSTLAHLTPPGLKTKARFMNIEPMISWAEMVLGVLSDPEAKESGVADVEKLEQKLGWLRQFQDWIASWKRCCDIIGQSLWWINTHGLEEKTSEQVQQFIASQNLAACPISSKMLQAIKEFLDDTTAGLKPGDRTWLSSEVLESAFGLFKRREGQQSRSGFTGLLLTLPALLRHWTASEVRAGLRRTSLQLVIDWVEESIGETLWAKRTAAFEHYGQKPTRKFKAA